jgi:hypothetical protein
MSSNPKLQFEADFAERIAECYSDLPYHNFEGHIMSSVGYFESIADDLESKHVLLDRHLCRIILLAHDAGYHEDHTALGYKTKEAYSADIATKVLADMGMERSKIEIVRSGIESTRYGYDKTKLTNLQKAVRLADIGNVSADEKEFLRNMGLLIQEAAVMKVPITTTFDEYRHATKSFLSAYLESAQTFVAEDGSEVQLDRHMSFINNITRLSSRSLATLIEASSKFTVPKQWFPSKDANK